MLGRRVPAGVRAGALLVAADGAYAMQAYQVAVARYGEFLSLHRDLPDAARAAMAMGWSELRRGRRTEARRAWTALADTFPGDPRAPLALLCAAEMAGRAGDSRGNRVLLDRIIRQYYASPYSSVAMMARSALAMRGQKEAEALRDLEQVIRTSGMVTVEVQRRVHGALAVPGAEAGLHSAVGDAVHRARAARGNTLEAFAGALLDRRHREPTPYTLHGLVLLGATDRGWSNVLVADLASRLSEDFPTYPAAAPLLTRVATAAGEAGQWPVARRAWEAMAARTPDGTRGPKARLAFAEALFRTGAAAEARAVAQSVAAAGGEETPPALLLLAEIHQAAREPHAALAVYDRLLKEHPRVDRTAASLLQHTRLLEELGQSNRTRPVLRRLVEVSSGEVAAEGAYRLAQGLRAEGQDAAAVEWYMTAAYVAEGSSWARLALLGAGASLTALNETKEALTVYRKLLPARPGVDPPLDRETSGEAAYRAGEILRDAGLPEDALDMFVASAHFVTGLPGERRALVGVLRCLVATGDRAGAEAIYRRLARSRATEPHLLAQARTALRTGGASDGGRESALPGAAR